jgi:AraC family transcriptional regulator
MESAVERAITFITEKYSEPLSLSDVANSAILSRFHFCRIFRDATGVTPGRFLSAVRIYQAKRMLATTAMNVTEVAFAVGYNSLGSFSNHFTDSVGISPGRFRRVARTGGFEPAPSPWELPPRGVPVTGTITLPEGYACGPVYLGAFDTPIIQRQPASWVVVEPAEGSYVLPAVPQGRWFLRAVAVADNAAPEPWTRRILLVGGAGPLTVAADVSINVTIGMRPRQPTDLPILLALPDLEPQRARSAEAELEEPARAG